MPDQYLLLSIYRIFLAKLGTMGDATKCKKWEELTLDAFTIYLKDKLSVGKTLHIEYQVTWVFNKDKRRQRSLWAEEGDEEREEET